MNVYEYNMVEGIFVNSTASVRGFLVHPEPNDMEQLLEFEFS